MNSSIENRELITLDAEQGLIHGTFHDVPNGNTAVRRSPVGVLFLNSLSLPRAATGDSAVYWADSLARAGYPTFRIDLPGLGDSIAELPSNLLDFINSGGFAASAVSVADQIVERFQLSGIVIVGHCAGAVSALFAAARSRHCRGVIMLDAYFHLPNAVRPVFRQKLSDWALHSRLGRVASSFYDRVRALRLYLRRNKLPENANRGLLRCWGEVASSGTPILILKAPARKTTGTKPRTGEFDYLEYVLTAAGKRSRVSVKLIEGTDHSFANRAGRQAVAAQLEVWLHTYCAPSASQEGRPTAGSPEPARQESVIVAEA